MTFFSPLIFILDVLYVREDEGEDTVFFHVVDMLINKTSLSLSLLREVFGMDFAGLFLLKGINNVRSNRGDYSTLQFSENQPLVQYR